MPQSVSIYGAMAPPRSS